MTSKAFCFPLGVAANIQNQSYNITSGHDQIMGEVDVQLRQRPQPPPISMPHQHINNHSTVGNGPLFMPSAMAEQTALRVRKWIESKSVSNVREYRPLLNAEIQQGCALRKTSALMNDKSSPRF